MTRKTCATSGRLFDVFRCKLFKLGSSDDARLILLFHRKPVFRHKRWNYLERRDQELNLRMSLLNADYDPDQGFRNERMEVVLRLLQRVNMIWVLTEISIWTLSFKKQDTSNVEISKVTFTHPNPRRLGLYSGPRTTRY